MIVTLEIKPRSNWISQDDALEVIADLIEKKGEIELHRIRVTEKTKHGYKSTAAYQVRGKWFERK